MCETLLFFSHAFGEAKNAPGDALGGSIFVLELVACRSALVPQGDGASLFEQVVFHQAYVEARAPGRLPNIGLTLLGPTLLAFGSVEQQHRFVPGILAGDEFWCQGYSEPDAGSDLANVATSARLEDGLCIVLLLRISS